MEMTKNWKDIPQATKDKAQPFLLEDYMQGTNKHSTNGMVQDLLHPMKPNETNLAGQIREHLEAELPKFLVHSRGFNQAKKAIQFVIRLVLTPPTNLENYLPEIKSLGPWRIDDAWIAANNCIFGAVWNNPHAWSK
jgi:hypothetical protein